MDLYDVMPRDQWQQEVNKLRSWDTIYAYTPAFSVNHSSKSNFNNLFQELIFY